MHSTLEADVSAFEANPQRRPTHTQPIAGEAIAVARPAPSPAGSSLSSARRGIDVVTQGVLDELDYGLVVVYPHNEVRFANRAARVQMATASCALSTEGRRIIVRRGFEAEPFAAALSAASRGRRSFLLMSDGGTTTTVAVVPVQFADDCGALLKLGRRRIYEALSVEMFGSRHGLTPGEMRVLKGLCDGLTPAEIARAGGTTLPTVRCQIAAVRSKTGATSIRGLLRQIAALPPIVSRLDCAA